MPRTPGKYGFYGSSGSSDLARRRRIEADNPGFRVCRLCETLIAAALLHPGTNTPYCRPCYLARARELSTRRRKPQHSDSEPAKLLRRNAELKSRGLFYCVPCNAEKPLSDRNALQSRCKPCGYGYIANWKKRTKAKRKLSERPVCLTPASVFGSKLGAAVRRVFRHLGVMECQKHGWQPLSGRRCMECDQRKMLKRQSKLAEVFVETVEMRELFRRSGGVCYLCGKPVKGREASVDHVTPLAKKGRHSYGNCRLAHRMCNSIKRDTGPLVAMCDPRISGHR